MCEPYTPSNRNTERWEILPLVYNRFFFFPVFLTVPICGWVGLELVDKENRSEKVSAVCRQYKQIGKSDFPVYTFASNLSIVIEKLPNSSIILTLQCAQLLCTVKWDKLFPIFGFPPVYSEYDETVKVNGQKSETDSQMAFQHFQTWLMTLLDTLLWLRRPKWWRNSWTLRWFLIFFTASHFAWRGGI